MLPWQSAKAETRYRTLNFHVYYLIDSYEVLPDSLTNDVTFASFAAAYDSLSHNHNVSNLHIISRGNVSIEGILARQLVLAKNRAISLAAYLSSTYSVPDSLINIVGSQPAIVEAERALAAFPDSIPGIDLAAIKRITRNVDGSKIRSAFYKIDKGNGNANWNWYVVNVLRPTRFADLNICYDEYIPDTQTIAPRPDEPKAETDTVAAPYIPRKSEFRIGTNLLYDAVTVANLFLEVGFGENFAFNCLATYSPWDVKSNLKIRTLLIQPEFRYYFSKDFRGHYIGIEGHYGWYNVALMGHTRYQDRDGNTALWGAGLSYGYVLPFSNHWGMEFSVSAGYANLVYDCFYNVDNGAKYTTSKRDWWGPTKAGISIYYQF